jgi:hypothetical protein
MIFSRLLRIVALVLGCGMFVPVSCSLIVFALHDVPLEKVDPGSRFYPNFFRVAAMSEGSVKYFTLSELPKFKSENPDYSFIVPKFQSHCKTFICYRVISDTGTEQIIEVEEQPDSLYAFKVWSRYRASHSGFTPISLRKVSLSIMFYAFLCSLVLYIIGRMLRRKMMVLNAQQDDHSATAQ